jgi:hypothetical protein
MYIPGHKYRLPRKEAAPQNKTKETTETNRKQCSTKKKRNNEMKNLNTNLLGT